MVRNLLLYSCSMGVSGLPDMYTLSLRAMGPRTGCGYVWQTLNAHVTIDKRCINLYTARKHELCAAQTITRIAQIISRPAIQGTK